MNLRHVLPAGLMLFGLEAAGCRVVPSTQQYLQRGDRFMREEQYAEAVIEYANAVKGDRLSGLAHARLAEAYLNAGKPPEALREYVLAADLLPDDIGLQLKAGQSLLLAHRYEDARARADRILEKDKNNIAAYLLKGHAAVGLKDLDGAIEEIKDALAVDPNSARSLRVLGAIEMNKGRLDEAEAAFKRAVEVEPASALTHLALANFYWASGRGTQAEQQLKQVIALEPRNVTALRGLAFLYVSTGHSAAAAAPLKRVADLVQDAASRLQLADIYLTTGRVGEAVSLLRELAAKPEGFTAATLRLAVYEQSQHHSVDAYRLLETVLSRAPANADALALKARLLLEDGHLEAALSSAKAAATADPRSLVARYLLGTIAALAGDEDAAIEAFTEVTRLNPRLVAATVQLAQLQLKRGAVPTAIDLGTQALRAAPGDTAASLVLARALAAHGETARAEALLRPLLRDRPQVAAAHLQMADLYLRKQDLAAARREVTRASELDPASIDTLSAQVAVELAGRNASRAHALVNDRLARSPADPALLLLAADVSAKTGDLAGQESLLRRAIEADDTNVAAFARLATLYVAQGKLDRAREEYDRISRQRPTSIAAPTMVGMLLEAENKPTEAQRVYEQVLQVQPRAVLAANNLAWLYAEHGGNLDTALELARMAKQLAPNLPHIDDTLGWVYYKKDLPELAIPALAAAVKGAPKSAAYRLHLGLAYASRGETDKARSSFDEALKLRPDFTEARTAREALGR